VHLICFTAKKGESVSKVVDKIEALVKERHSISPTDKEAVMKINIEEQIKQISYLFIGIGALIWIVGIGTLIAGAVGISNIMLVVVKERTKEIGVQRAIGARPWTIVSQILTESVFLTTIAGFIGLALGTLVLHLADLALTVSQASSTEEQGAFFRHPEIGLGLALSALAVLVVTGFLAGLIPAQKAVRIKPIEALRHE
jgi:putative ABC transport system permease protein